MKNNKCLKCTERYEGCHKNCDNYKEYLKELDVIKTNKKISKDIAKSVYRRNYYGK